VNGFGGAESPVWAQFAHAVAPFTLGEHVRRLMSGRTVDDLIRPTELWTLNEPTIKALRDAFPLGFLQYYPADDGWLEDLVLYRDGELMLGAITHEGAAVLRVSPDESAAFTEAGFPSHDQLPYIGY
jgi:hypothetical protein